MKKFYSMNLVAGLASLMLLVGTVACNNGGGGGSGTTPVTYPYGTVTGITNPVAIYNSILSSSYSGDGQMSMSLIGQSGITSGYNPAVGFTGTLNLTSYNLSFCGAPGGSYALSTLQTGVMSGTSIGPLVLQASGPSLIRMEVSYGIIENAGARVSFNMNVYVNGQPCGLLITL